MDDANSPIQQPKRRRIRWWAGLALMLLVMLWLLFASVVLLPRLREHNGEWPNPVQTVKNWLFPPEELLFIDVDGGGVFLIADKLQAPVDPPRVVDVDADDVGPNRRRPAGPVDLPRTNEERP